MSAPHKHAAIIKAWADGAEIQMKVAGEWMDIQIQELLEQTYGGGVEHFRVKPTNVVRYCAVAQMPAGTIYVTDGKTADGFAASRAFNGVTTSDKIVGLVRLEFNPDTAELVSATMEKP